VQIESLSWGGIIAGVIVQFLPVFAAMAAIMGASRLFRRKLGIYGQIFDSGNGIAGLALVLFWVLTAMMADQIATFDPVQQFGAMKNALPGAIEPDSGLPFYFGGDLLGRCVFSCMVYGRQVVMTIAPLATLFAYMVGIMLGLPAGYFGGRPDTAVSFIANLVLAFPVILLFYLLVTPEIQQTAIPSTMSAVLFLFPIVFLLVFFFNRFRERPEVLWLYLTPVCVFRDDPPTCTDNIRPPIPI
jgi:peptide/nickel transport system permease protein